MKTYLVGGAVRDILLGLTPSDRDYVVVGATPQDMIDLGYQQVGKSFPVFLDPNTDNQYALARTERSTAPGYNGFEVDFNTSVTLYDDLYRRDLTINAMAVDVVNEEQFQISRSRDLVIDPFNGMADLDNKVLQHVSYAFCEDPLRVLRVARFAARYAFEPSKSLMTLMHDMVDRNELRELTPERVLSEIERGIMEPYPSKMFEILDSIDAYDVGGPLEAFYRGYLNRNLIEKLEGYTRRMMALNISFEYGYAHVLQKLRLPKEIGHKMWLYYKLKDSIQSYHTLTCPEKLRLIRAVGGVGNNQNLSTFFDVCQAVFDHTCHNVPDCDTIVDNVITIQKDSLKLRQYIPIYPTNVPAQLIGESVTQQYIEVLKTL